MDITGTELILASYYIATTQAVQLDLFLKLH